MQGAAKVFNASEGFRIHRASDGSKDADVRSGDIQDDGGHNPLSENQKVESELSVAPQGLQARKVKLVG